MDVVALDLELTGLDPALDEIVEVGVVRQRRGAVARAWSSLVRAERSVTAGAAAVTGLDDDALVGAPALPGVLDELRGWLDGAVVVAHGGDLDDQILRRATGALGIPGLPGAAFDTREMARNLLALRSHALADLAEALGVPNDGLHRALPDATATLAVFWRLVALYDPDDELDAAGLAELVARSRWDSPWRREQRRLLEQGLRGRRTVHLRYVTRDDDGAYVVTPREVAVYKISGRRVQGFCHLRGEERVFRMERLRDVQPGDRPYVLPAFSARI